MSLVRYTTASIPQLFSDLERYTVGFEDLFDRVSSLSGTYATYPPVNLVEESENSLRYEMALADFNRSEIKVYTENGKLTVEGNKENKVTEHYIQRGVAYRNFRWSRIISERWKVDSVAFENGLLTIKLNRQVPEHEKRREYLV